MQILTTPRPHPPCEQLLAETLVWYLYVLTMQFDQQPKVEWETIIAALKTERGKRKGESKEREEKERKQREGGEKRREGGEKRGEREEKREERGRRKEGRGRREKENHNRLSLRANKRCQQSTAPVAMADLFPCCKHVQGTYRHCIPCQLQVEINELHTAMHIRFKYSCTNNYYVLTLCYIYKIIIKMRAGYIDEQ